MGNSSGSRKARDRSGSVSESTSSESVQPTHVHASPNSGLDTLSSHDSKGTATSRSFNLAAYHSHPSFRSSRGFQHKREAAGTGADRHSYDTHNSSTGSSRRRAKPSRSASAYNVLQAHTDELEVRDAGAGDVALGHVDVTVDSVGPLGTLADLRVKIENELDHLPRPFVFLRANVPVGLRQEAKLQWRNAALDGVVFIMSDVFGVEHGHGHDRFLSDWVKNSGEFFFCCFFVCLFVLLLLLLLLLLLCKKDFKTDSSL